MTFTFFRLFGAATFTPYKRLSAFCAMPLDFSRPIEPLTLMVIPPLRVGTICQKRVHLLVCRKASGIVPFCQGARESGITLIEKRTGMLSLL
jgi:hypothetical protein